MKKKISDIQKLNREEVRKPKLLKTTFYTSCNSITQHNPLLSNFKIIIRNHLPTLYSNQQMLDIFRHNTISVTYKKKIRISEKFYGHHYFLGLPSKTNVLQKNVIENVTFT